MYSEKIGAKTGSSRLQIGISAAMKPHRDGWFGAGRALNQPIECSAENLRPPEIVGEIENPMLETMRRLWWRAFDRVSCSDSVRSTVHS